jgi:DNA polymerase V
MTKSENDLRFGQALKEARLTKGMSQEELAHESDLDRTYVSMLEREVKNPTLATISKLAKSLGLTPIQLVSRSQQLAQGDASQRNLKKTILKPPFYGTSVSCGKPITEDYEIEKQLSLDEEFIRNPSETFFIKAGGDSMSPTIWDGDILIVALKRKPSNGDIVLAQVNDEFTVKRFFKTNKGIKLLPDNNHFTELTISENQTCVICGIVVGLARSLNISSKAHHKF